MYEKSLNTIEFNKVVDLLANEAESELGYEYCLQLKPSTAKDEIEKWIEDTDEAFQLIIKRGNPPLFGVKSIGMEIKRVEMGGGLSPGGLLKISETLRCARALKNYLSDTKGDDKVSIYKNISGLIGNLGVYRSIEEAIGNAIISENEISDGASTTLRSLRRTIRSKTDSIKDKLEKLISSEDSKRNLSDSIYTMREGRYVVPVKRDFKGSVPGLVHDVSSSGATLFVEPVAVLELNNEIKELMVKEREEIERILMELSMMVAEHSYEIGANEHILKELDFIFAKGKLAINQRATKPVLNDLGIINIKKGRHPLLKVDKVVPIDIYIGDKFNTLVITGPNTGGKTVSIKTVGLLTAMAQAGLFIPAAERSQIGVFDDIFADIGDEQSIEQSLSTFSSHMVNIVDILGKARYNTLALFDELGAGTDPTEGAVLAIAILDELKARGVRTIATTHYNQLKVYALTTENVENASMEFDIETLSPTYRLLIGIPGKSNAFEISKRLGLGDDIINSARDLVEAENIQFEDMLSEIEKNKNIIEAEREEAERTSAEIEKLKLKLETEKEKLESMREKVIRDAKVEAKSIIKEASDEAKLIIDELKEVSTHMDKDAARRIQQAQDMLRATQGKLDKALQEEILEVRNVAPPKDLKAGDTVEILSLKQKGIIINPPDASGNTMVQVGLMKMTLPVNALKLSTEDEEAVERSAKKMHVAKSKYIKKDIDLRGKNIEEAMMELDKYLDDAYLSGLKQVEIIHGKGTGALREGLRPYFKRHKHIKSTRVGGYNEGGTGVTIVELK